MSYTPIKRFCKAKPKKNQLTIKSQKEKKKKQKDHDQMDRFMI
jgi:hypothetical protein